MDLTDEQIQKIIEQHKRRRAYDKERYHAVLKNDTAFVEKNRERARKHYEENAQKKLDNYAQNKDYLSARASYRYYMKTNRAELFKDKHPDKYQILVDRGVIVS